MNRKGFTLVELLAVIVLISVLMGVATYSVVGVINSSKKKSEEIFLKKLGGLIDNYISLSLNDKKNYALESISTGEDCYNKNGNKAVVVGKFSVDELWNTELVARDDLLNPSNKKKCFVNKNPYVYVYRDDDFVYYYYLNLDEYNNCELETEYITSCYNKDIE